MLKSGKLPQGCGIGIYGYHWQKETKKRLPIEREAVIVQRMFEMSAGGVSTFKIAITLNAENIPTKSGKKWEARTVSRILRNTAYYGVTYFGQTAGSDRRKTDKETWLCFQMRHQQL
jgi:site-specific DNA recombinase